MMANGYAMRCLRSFSSTPADSRRRRNDCRSSRGLPCSATPRFSGLRHGASRWVDDGVRSRHSQLAAAMLQAVGSDISHIDELNGRIVTTTREQFTASGEIVGRLQSVQTIAQNTADDVETLALSSQRLPPIAVRLDALGRTFHQ